MPLSGYTILSVDDYEAHNYALSRILENAGCKVLQAYTGSQALDLAAQKPNLILLDVNLPDFNGFEVCRRLKHNPDTAHIPVVFLSATYHFASAKAEAESVGANGFLFYPVETDQLLAVIQGQIAR